MLPLFILMESSHESTVTLFLPDLFRSHVHTTTAKYLDYLPPVSISCNLPVPFFRVDITCTWPLIAKKKDACTSKDGNSHPLISDSAEFVVF